MDPEKYVYKVGNSGIRKNNLNLAIFGKEIF